MASPDQPVLPDFGGGSLPNVVAAVAPGRPGPAPDWVPAGLDDAERVVLLVLDGLGWEQLQERTELAPTILSGTGGPITSVAPSTTATALTSITTGLAPSRHGVVGYRVHVPQGVLNVLKWTVDGRDARRELPAAGFQPHPALLQARTPTAVVTKAELTGTGFTAAHLAPAPLRGWATPSALGVEVRRALAEGVRFVYAYYDGVDRIAHRHGLDEHYDAELRSADRLVAEVLCLLPPGVGLAVTADHGQVEVGTRIEVLDGALMEGVVMLSGEGRFRWLHTAPGATDATADAARDLYGDAAWVVTAEQMADEGWLGGTPSEAVRRRLGDVALVPHEPLAFLDPADTGEQRLVARHGSLTPAEMLVPLLGWAPRT